MFAQFRANRVLRRAIAKTFLRPTNGRELARAGNAERRRRRSRAACATVAIRVRVFVAVLKSRCFLQAMSRRRAARDRAPLAAHAPPTRARGARRGPPREKKIKGGC
ncbi:MULTISPECIES: hypothetical protein [Lysobacteraceae]|uniref:hypothetical protein n=1 Tax=Lysobacteraceae TaxID=32033 RepID=UPI001BD02916|nr:MULTISPECIES: hypothetical protein [Lysobacter]